MDNTVYKLLTIYSGSGNARSSLQPGLGSGVLQQRRMSDESIQSGVVDTQEMQTIQVLLYNTFL